MWAWLASVVTRGWLAGEDPRSGWGLASAATAFVLLALVIVEPERPDHVATMRSGPRLGYVIVLAYSGGHLLLLAAFAVGLPAIDEPDEADDEDFDDEDEEDDFETTRTTTTSTTTRTNPRPVSPARPAAPRPGCAGS